MGWCIVSKCPFLSTYEEEVECFKECALYNPKDEENTCPFIDIKGKGSKKVRNIYEYDYLKEDKTSPLAIIYNENYI